MRRRTRVKLNRDQGTVETRECCSIVSREDVLGMIPAPLVPLLPCEGKSARRLPRSQGMVRIREGAEDERSLLPFE